MFRQNTVIILGAAVSCEVGLPLGSDLKRLISDVLPNQSAGDDHVRNALFSRGSIQENSAAISAIRNALPRAASIDNLIEHRGFDPAFKHCAKVGIVASILKGEHGSDLYRRNSAKLGSILAENTTYADIFRIIVGNAGSLSLHEAVSRVKFVNFNYDRCLEHYFYDWIIGYSGVSENEARHLVNSMCVVRPYGSIGPLPFSYSDSPAISFGEDLGRIDLNDVAENILTFSEERQSDTDVAIRGVMREAQQLIFLGCAYHVQNMKLLAPDCIPRRQTHGTCYMIPPEDKESHPSLESFSAPTALAFKNSISRWPAPNGFQGDQHITFEPLTSRQLIAKYSAQWIEY